jgi:hypothetical protein
MWPNSLRLTADRFTDISMRRDEKAAGGKAADVRAHWVFELIVAIPNEK